MKVGALIVAAGRGERAGGDIPKQYRLLAGAPVLTWSMRALLQAGIRDIVVAIDPVHEDLCRAAIADAARIVQGGSTRTIIFSARSVSSYAACTTSRMLPSIPRAFKF